MLGVTDLPTYLAGLVLIILLPGPNSLYVLSVAARRGVRTGYTAAAGVWCGDTVLMTLSAPGSPRCCRPTPCCSAIVKYAGAGLSDLAGDRDDAGRVGDVARAAPAGGRAVGGERDVRGGAAERPYRRALVVSLFNPKAILFFIAFFVQFVDPGYAYPALSFLVLGALAQIGELPLPHRR